MPLVNIILKWLLMVGTTEPLVLPRPSVDEYVNPLIT